MALNREWHPDTKRQEVCDESGNVPFEMIYEVEGDLVPLDRILYGVEVDRFELSPALQENKRTLIDQRLELLNKRYEKAVEKWREEGTGDEPPRPQVFDGALVGASSWGTVDYQGESHLALKFRTTSYFDYMVTRDGDLDLQMEERALPLGMCGVLLAYNEELDQDLMIYTQRTTKVEAYSGFNHVAGGMMAPSKWDIPYPAGQWNKELFEEGGMIAGEVRIEGVNGMALDRHFVHPEVFHQGRLVANFGDIFVLQDDNDLKPKRETDKEVNFKWVEWKADEVKNVLLADRWVPTGWGNVWVAGRRAFGNDWAEDVRAEYRDHMGQMFNM